MALTLILEDGTGLANANSYASLIEAAAYHAGHLYASVWNELAQETQTVALVHATRLLDEQVEWHGWKATATQALRWPRGGVNDRDTLGDPRDLYLYGYFLSRTVVPVWLKNATAELARCLKIADRTADFDTAGFSKIDLGPLSLTIDKADRNSVLPDSVMSIVSPYGRVHRSGGIVATRLLRM